MYFGKIEIFIGSVRALPLNNYFFERGFDAANRNIFRNICFESVHFSSLFEWINSSDGVITLSAARMVTERTTMEPFQVNQVDEL